MSQYSKLANRALVALLCTLIWGPSAVGDDFAFFHENVMGTSLALHVRADTRELALRAEATVLGEIDRLTATFSGYDPASEFSRWQSTLGEPVPVSRELFEVLRSCDRWSTGSGRAFDVRAEVFTQLWSRAARLNRVPAENELNAALALLATPPWRLDEGARTARRLSSCPLSLNGIAKGYIVERACDLAFDPKRGVHGILLNVGGDLRARGDATQTVDIVDPASDSESSEPMAFISVKDRSVSTSGSSQRGFRINGSWYSHVIDPRSGVPVQHVRSATVVAPRGADADALAKVCNVLTPEQSLELLSRLSDVECLVIARGGRVITSAGWSRLERPGPAATLTSAVAPSAQTDGGDKGDSGAAPSDAWDPEFELAINFEINRPAAETGRYRRPYVAIWLEDKDGKPVRTLVLWVSLGGSGPFQWLPDLKRWYSRDEERKQVERKDIFVTTARPTREPGRYKAIWDGRDNHGQQLARGQYTVYIEAAREHGTYQSIHKPVNLSDKPFREDLKGNVEIKSASIEYRRKAQAK
jgi:FAD:protein FMN transferase